MLKLLQIIQILKKFLTQFIDNNMKERILEIVKKENNRRKSAEYKYRHWKVSPVGNRVEPEKNR